VIQLTALSALRATVRDARDQGHQIRFVPTMGALHAGHAALMQAARRDGGFVLASIFVNPTQFGPSEDFTRYPRTPEADAALAASAGADAVWLPDVETIYPAGESTRISVGALGACWEGAFRPGHFDGVATVVAKLLQATSADVLYLGEKDFQQTVVLRRLVRDLLIPTEIVVVPTVREDDGVALSSRNRYLSADERRSATAIPRALRAAVALAAAGERRGAALRDAMHTAINAETGLRLQYAELVDPDSLAPVEQLTAPARAIVAAFAGTTRLIDNILVTPSLP
jgi:pantoate--beta-alanine ligase